MIAKTAPPERSPFPPREGVPVPTTDAPALEQHWRKHPSDFHADNAAGDMVAALCEVDSAKRSELLATAQINATLSLRDAVLEVAATLRESIRLITDPKE